MEYIKDEEILDIKDSEKKLQLIESIIQTRNDLKKAHINFDFAGEDLIDFYTYQIKALQSKLDYLINLAKSKKIEFNNLDKKVV